MAQQTTYSIGHQAYLNLILHATKHPHQPVNGVLLGKTRGEVVDIVTTVPLLHNWTTLSPMMEIGLDLVCIILHSWYRRIKPDTRLLGAVACGRAPRAIAARGLLSSLGKRDGQQGIHRSYWGKDTF